MLVSKDYEMLFALEPNSYTFQNNMFAKIRVRGDTVCFSWFEYESGHKKMCLMSYANNKGADQPARPRSARFLQFAIEKKNLIILSFRSLSFVAERSLISIAQSCCF